MKGNKGISLIEVIVTVAIMAIIVGGFGLSISVVSRRNVDKMADLIQAGTKKAVVSTMSKKDVDGFTISKESGVYYLKIGAGQKTQLGESPITLSYTFNTEPEKESAVYTEIAEGESIRIGISKSSGTFQSVQVGDNLEYYRGLRISNGNRTIILQLIPETGNMIKVE